MFHDDVAPVCLSLARQKDDAMYIGDAGCRFGDGIVTAAARNPAGKYFIQFTGKPSAIFPVKALENSLTICSIASSDYALPPVCINQATRSVELKAGV